MKTDIYTKIVLTIIAIFLGVLVFQNTTLITTAKADTTTAAPAPIPSSAQSAPVDVNITHVNGIPITVTSGYSSFSHGIPIDVWRK